MKKFFTLVPLILSVMMVSVVGEARSAGASSDDAVLSDTVVVDSLSPDTAVEELHEIVVQAPKVVRRADMDVYYPSKSAVDVSKNGVQLLSNLMIPSLTVADALDKIQAAGQEVQIRINGRVSTIEQVRALLPETVKRVEWIDNPGLQYNGAQYVLNFIVSNPTAGGSLQTMARQSLNALFGLYFADLKLNSGRSQFGLNVNYKLTDNIKTHRDYTETFTYPDGSSLTRTEASRGGSVNNTFGTLRASYNYVIPDTTVVMVDLYCFDSFSNKMQYDGLLSLSNGTDDILLSDVSGDNGVTPTLSAYWEQHFAHKQTLVVDFRTSLYYGKTYSDYVEQLPGSTDLLTDVHTSIKDRNQVYAVEANYIKRWNTSRLTAGASYVANRNRSVYENLGGEVFHQRQDKAYVFVEYFHRIGKVSLTAGLGAQYTDFLFKETNEGSNSWNLRPQATIAYNIKPEHKLRLSFQSWQSAPSLSESNVAPQQMDGFQWRVGNPDLKTSTSYLLTLRYSFSFPRVGGSLGVKAFSSPDAITPLLYWDNDRLITTYENSRGFQNIRCFLSPQVEVIPGWLTVGGYLQYTAERMRGTGYTLYNHNWSGNVDISLSHWGFTLTGQYARALHDLWGEKITWGENYSLIDLSYNMKKWQFSAGMLMPFGKYDQGSKMLSKWNTNEQHMRLDMRIPYVSISYNLQWGRQKRSAQKIIDSDAKVDTSSAAGR